MTWFTMIYSTIEMYYVGGELTKDTNVKIEFKWGLWKKNSYR